MDVQVSVSSDDTERWGVNGFWLDSPNDRIDTFNDPSASTGIRFVGVGVPQGVTITNAYLTVRARFTMSTGGASVYGQSADNPPTFTDWAEYDGRVRTGANVHWTPSEWVVDTDYNSPDITTVIQEIVSRPGWTSGNALVLFLLADGSQSTYGYSYDSSPAYAPRLHIEYALPTSTPTPTATPTLTPTATATKPSGNYRSIGINAGILYSTGNASVNLGGTVVNFGGGASLPTNVGVGDRLLIGGETFFILSRDSATQATVQTAAAATHSGEAYTITRAYNTFQAWETDRQGDLVSENRFEVGVAYDDGTFVAAGSPMLEIEGSITDSTHYMRVTVGPGQGHNGTAGTGVILDGVDSTQFGIDINDDYARVDGLELVRFSSLSGGPAAVRVKVAQNVLLEDLLIHDFHSTGGAVYGIRTGTSGVGSFTVRNSIIYDGKESAIHLNNPETSGTVDNCTVFGIGNWGISVDGAGVTLTVTNSISMNNGSSGTDFVIRNGGTLIQSYNMSEDGTAAGTGSLTWRNPFTQFVSTTLGSENFHLTVSSDALDAGTSLAGQFGDDVDQEKRPQLTSWDMGADEYTGPAPTATPTPTATVIPGGTFVVNHTGDGADANTGDGICQTSTPGQCTLRAAIEQANATAGANTIAFNIPGLGAHTIQPGNALPTISDPVTVDGTTQPGFSGAPIIELDGSLTSGGTDGLTLTAGSSTIRGLVINNFPGSGIYLTGSSASGNLIAGNYVGTDLSGSLTFPNYNGIDISNGAANNIIGGTTASDRNVFSGNTSTGINLTWTGTTGNLILGNYVGVNAAGDAALPNGWGVSVSSTAGYNTIGGTAPGAGNVISGNTNSGVYASGTDALGNVLVGNFIGTDATGTLAIGNGTYGVDLSGADFTVGGTSAGSGNTIANNGSDGVAVYFSGALTNRILGNAIYANTGLGIDLDDDGPTANDAGDGDTGPNLRQNYPVLSAAVTDGAGLVNITGSLNSLASTTFRLEFFASAAGDPSDYGEGQRYLGFLNVTTNGSGNASFNQGLTAMVAVGETVTATATDPSGNTSEFSAYVLATSASACGVVQSATGQTSGGTSVTATFALQPVPDHLLVAIAGNRDAAAVSAPSGWSVAISQTANTPGQAVFYKFAGASEPTTVTVSGYSVSTRLGLQIYEFCSTDKVTPVNQTGSATGSGTTVSSGSLTTSQAETLLVAGLVTNVQTTFSSWTNSFFERADFSNAGNPPGQRSTYGGAEYSAFSIGTYSTTATAGASGAWRGQIVAFNRTP